MNTVTSLVESKKAQLVIIAHDVDPIEVCLSHYFASSGTSPSWVQLSLEKWSLAMMSEFLQLNSLCGSKHELFNPEQRPQRIHILTNTGYQFLVSFNSIFLIGIK